jgi:hypothetical protein
MTEELTVEEQYKSYNMFQFPPFLSMYDSGSDDKLGSGEGSNWILGLSDGNCVIREQVLQEGVKNA